MSTFKTEMDIFFARNCYSQKDRSKVQACRQFRLAQDANDLVYGQEIAMQVLEGKMRDIQEEGPSTRISN